MLWTWNTEPQGNETMPDGRCPLPGFTQPYVRGVQHVALCNAKRRPAGPDGAMRTYGQGGIAVAPA